ncbi:hypothetical protein C2W62_52255, partial [Candidatus Entotheonella serta]
MEELPQMFMQSCKGQPVDTWLVRKWSLVTELINTESYPLYCLANSLSVSLKSSVAINAYYTPANALGFDWHEDPHDVFIWQLQGNKTWRVVTPGERPQDREPLIETVLLPGHLLYIPQGFPHVAKTCADETSHHLSIGFLSREEQVRRVVLE